MRLRFRVRWRCDIFAAARSPFDVTDQNSFVSLRTRTGFLVRQLPSSARRLWRFSAAQTRLHCDFFSSVVREVVGLLVFIHRARRHQSHREGARSGRPAIFAVSDTRPVLRNSTDSAFSLIDSSRIAPACTFIGQLYRLLCSATASNVRITFRLNSGLIHMACGHKQPHGQHMSPARTAANGVYRGDAYI